MRMSQDQLARLARERGLSWSRSSVAAIEAGNKTLGISELVLLTLALGLRIDAFLEGDETIPLDNGAELALRDVRSILAGKPPLLAEEEELPEYPDVTLRRYLRWRKGGRSGKPEVDRLFRRVALAGNGEAEQKAARNLCLDPDVLSAMAFQMWGRSLTDERDVQVELAEHDLESPQSIRALRGHITRKLLEQLDDSVRMYLDIEGLS
jgi:hypothetical protein